MIFYIKFNDLNRKNDDIHLTFSKNSYLKTFLIGRFNCLPLAQYINFFFKDINRRFFYEMEKKQVSVFDLNNFNRTFLRM